MSDPNQSVEAATASDDAPSLPPVQNAPTISLNVTDTLRCDKCFFSWDLSGGGDIPYPDMESGEDPWVVRRSDVQPIMDKARDGWLRAAATCDGNLPCDLSICVSQVTGNPLKLPPMRLRV